MHRSRLLASCSAGVTAAAIVVVGLITLVTPNSVQVRTARPAPVKTAGTLATAPPTLAADAAVPQVEIFSAPDVSTGTSMSEVPEGGPLVFLVISQQAGWIQVQIPRRPNGARAWVRASDVRVRQVHSRIVVHLAAQTVTVLVDNRPIMTTRSVVGKADSPTPVGSFYVTAVLPLSNPNGAYGAGAFGLAAFSDVYLTFGGGPGQVAIHGTNEPNLIGQADSHGCVRILNDAWTQMSVQVVTGSPVLIEP